MNKVTKEAITAKIKDVQYQRLSDKLTHCIITLENGFQVTGESACVDPANYDPAIGERIAYENAFDKIWEVEGYLLQEMLHLTREREKIAFPENNPLKTRFKEALENVRQQTNTGPIFQYPLTPKESYSSSNVLKRSGSLQKFDFDPEEKKSMDKFYAGKEIEAGISTGNLNEGSIKENRDQIHVRRSEFGFWQAISRLDHFPKKELFREMFPGATESDFKKLESRQSITDELSFMEKAETLEIENLQGAITHDEKMIRYNKLYRQELDLIIQSLKGSVRKSPERSTAIRKLTEGVMWLQNDIKILENEK